VDADQPTPGPQQREPEEEGQAESMEFVRMGLWFYGAMALVAVLWRSGLYGEPVFYASLAAEQRGVSGLTDGGLGLLAGGSVVAISYVVTRATGWGERLARELARAIGPMTIPDALLMAAASGFSEELLFRGALQPRVGLLVASVLFGAVHFMPRREVLPWTGFATLSGLLFGWLFEWTGNLVAPIVAHTVVNAVNLPLLVRQYGPGAGGERGPG
jgi:membrane protease YdiL (CAAX protease family)